MSGPWSVAGAGNGRGRTWRWSSGPKFLCNVITKCHVCGGSLIYWNRGKRTKPMYYCSTKIHRGTCENGAGIPVEALDYAVKVKLLDLLDKDFDKVLDLCEEQAQVWREKAAMPGDQKAQLEREQKRLEGAIDRLLDQIEAGQAVGDRLKKRQEELDTIKGKLELADVPELSREDLADSLRPYGPLVALGVGDVLATRQLLRKIGVTSIVVRPVGPQAWEFTGQAELQRGLYTQGHLRAPPSPPGRSEPPGGAWAPLDFPTGFGGHPDMAPQTP